MWPFSSKPVVVNNYREPFRPAPPSAPPLESAYGDASVDTNFDEINEVASMKPVAPSIAATPPKKKLTDVRELPDHIQELLNGLHRRRAIEEDDLAELEKSYQTRKAAHLDEIRVVDENIKALDAAIAVYSEFNVQVIDEAVKQLADTAISSVKIYEQPVTDTPKPEKRAKGRTALKKPK